jgi:hypothetical protein
VKVRFVSSKDWRRSVEFRMLKSASAPGGAGAVAGGSGRSRRRPGPWIGGLHLGQDGVEPVPDPRTPGTAPWSPGCRAARRVGEPQVCPFSASTPTTSKLISPHLDGPTHQEGCRDLEHIGNGGAHHGHTPPPLHLTIVEDAAVGDPEVLDLEILGPAPDDLVVGVHNGHATICCLDWISGATRTIPDRLGLEAPRHPRCTGGHPPGPPRRNGPVRGGW